MNYPDALQRASKAKLKVKSAAVFVEVEELRSIENGAPIAADKFVSNQVVPSFCGRGSRLLDARFPLDYSASFIVLRGAGGFVGEAD
jgi:hypothetical protein